MNDYLAEGDWNAICANCGRKMKASELVKDWKGLYVCPDHPGVTRHPQDFVRGFPDKQTVPWSQPLHEDSFVLYCTPNGRTAIAEYAVAECAIASFIDPGFDPSGD